MSVSTRISRTAHQSTALPSPQSRRVLGSTIAMITALLIATLLGQATALGSGNVRSDGQEAAPPTLCPEGFHLQNGHCVASNLTNRQPLDDAGVQFIPCPEGFHLGNHGCQPSNLTIEQRDTLGPTPGCPEGFQYQGQICIASNLTSVQRAEVERQVQLAWNQECGHEWTPVGPFGICTPNDFVPVCPAELHPGDWCVPDPDQPSRRGTTIRST